MCSEAITVHVPMHAGIIARWPCHVVSILKLRSGSRFCASIEQCALTEQKRFLVWVKVQVVCARVLPEWRPVTAKPCNEHLRELLSDCLAAWPGDGQRALLVLCWCRMVLYT